MYVHCIGRKGTTIVSLKELIY